MWTFEITTVQRKKPRQPTRAVSLELTAGPDGPVRVHVDFASLPPPEAFFYANTVVLEIDPELAMSTLRFGWFNMDSQLRDIVDIVMPTVALKAFANTLKPIKETLERQVPSPAKSRFALPYNVPDALRAVRLYANLVYMAVSEGETCADYYYLPPRDIHLAKTRGAEITAFPVVRIMLSSVVSKKFVGDILTSTSHLIEPGASNAATSKQAGKQ